MEAASAVDVCPPERRREALMWLLDQPPGGVDGALVEEWLARAARDPRASQGLLTAWDGHGPAAALLTTLTPGRIGTITPPRIREAPHARYLQPLLMGAVDFARRQGAAIAQALLTPDHPAATAFAEAGFRGANLRLLGCELSAHGPEHTQPEVRFEPYEDDALLERIVEATYEGTLDCAWLNDWRDTADVLATSRATGVHDPRLWLLASVDSQPIGCLLLADHPLGNSLELVYMGVLPPFRGRGWGRTLIAEAQRQCRARGRARLVLFVDEANWPARNSYLAAGFGEWDQRVCFLRRV